MKEEPSDLQLKHIQEYSLSTAKFSSMAGHEQRMEGQETSSSSSLDFGGPDDQGMFDGSLGFKDVEVDGTSHNIDSGVGSNVPGTSQQQPHYPPSLREAQNTSLVAIRHGDINKRFPTPGGANLPLDGGQRNQSPSVSSTSIQQRLDHLTNLAQTQRFTRIKYGSKKDVYDFLHHIETAEEDSGIFLSEAEGFFGRSRFRRGDDYVFVMEFQPGKHVTLWMDKMTDRKFVTKLASIEPTELPFGKTAMRLSRPHQVSLVVDHQDDCPGLGRIFGIIKRKINTKYFGEIFMEFYPGGTLEPSSLFRSLDISAKWRLAMNILINVLYLHSKDIVHGDIKYENMVFNEKGYPILIDMESAYHPTYKNPMRATYTFLPPWFRRCCKSRDFELLKSLDLWAVGVVLLHVITGQALLGDERVNLQRCRSCNPQSGPCLHVVSKYLILLEQNPDIVMKYLPIISQSDDPDVRRLACLIHGLLTPAGPTAQLTAEQAVDGLLDDNVIAVIKKDGNQRVPPAVVPCGISMGAFMNTPAVQQLKNQYPDLQEGMYFTWDQVYDGRPMDKIINKHDRLTECCVLRIHAPIRSHVCPSN
ncbi:uncharacterized protein LOC124254784 isoform X2 [Haliotis rubra]|uniref:uncharacterized protein LOC124254784 isoform X2 n=1 Tax=Haliotis rubra TaxID=36100 RepID=UPI001EE517E8|nr:uncharacterized protein LOC124254784 isoform X2 [Haliotis rubra]